MVCQSTDELLLPQITFTRGPFSQSFVSGINVYSLQILKSVVQIGGKKVDQVRVHKTHKFFLFLLLVSDDCLEILLLPRNLTNLRTN